MKKKREEGRRRDGRFAEREGVEEEEEEGW